MIEIIKACSLDEALILLHDEEDFVGGLKPIRLPNVDNYHDYENLGFCFYKMIAAPNTNDNQTTTQVENVVFRDTKKFETGYAVIREFGGAVVRSGLLKKGDAVNAARKYTEKHYESTEVIIGKTLTNCSRTQAKITYKPSQKQIEGEWIFIK